MHLLHLVSADQWNSGNKKGEKSKEVPIPHCGTKLENLGEGYMPPKSWGGERRETAGSANHSPWHEPCGLDWKYYRYARRMCLRRRELLSAFKTILWIVELRYYSKPTCFLFSISVIKDHRRLHMRDRSRGMDLPNLYVSFKKIS